VLAEVRLPIGGLMSDQSIEEVAERCDSWLTLHPTALA